MQGRNQTWPFPVEPTVVVESAVEGPFVEVVSAADCLLLARCPAKTLNSLLPLGWSFSVSVGLCLY